MNMRAWTAALIILALALPVLAVSPAADNSYEAWVQVQKASLTQTPALIQLKIEYTEGIQLQSGRPYGGGDQPAGDLSQTQLRPLAGAVMQVLLDGKPLTDKNGNPVCDKLTAAGAPGSGNAALEPGEASCYVPGGLYSANPNPLNRTAVALADWPTCAEVQVRLVSSPLQGKIKALHAAPQIVCPSGAKVGSLFYTLHLGDAAARSGLLAACLPIFLIVGLLVASMYYRGRDPLSLFDITTPRLPTMRKLRMKPSTMPMHLASKGRMTDRIIGRANATISSTLFALYRKGGRRLPKDGLQGLMPSGQAGFIPKWTTITAQSPFANQKAMEDAMRKLNRLIENSGASEAEKQRARQILLDQMQLRQALLLEKKVHEYGRTGDRTLSIKARGTVGALAPLLAKPWRLVPAWRNKNWANNLPGIPYVERTGLVINDWLANRGGNVSMRQQLRRTAAAEVGVALGVLDREKSPYARRHLYDNRKIGNIPFIVEKMRNETWVLGKAIVDEHMRAMVLAAVLKREEVRDKDGLRGVKFGIDEKRLAEIVQMVQRAQKDATKEKITDQMLFRELFAKALQDYARKNLSQMQFVDAAGLTLSERDKQDFLKQAEKHIAEAFRLLREDGQYLKGSMLADFASDAAKKMDPDKAFRIYGDMTRLLEDYRAKAGELRDGRVPLVYLGHDMAEIIGRSLSARQLDGRMRADLTESQRMVIIRQGMEEELMKKRLFERIFNGSAGAMAGGRLDAEWKRAALAEMSLQKLRGELDYYRRGEWAARNYLTGYNANRTGYVWESERNKIEILRQRMSWMLGHGQETLLRNYWTQVERNQLVYLTMKEMALKGVYTGKAGWDADAYNAWKEQGVRFKDAQKGAWLIGGERSLVPVASNVLRDKDGRLLGVRVELDAQGRLRHNTPERIQEIDFEGKRAYVHGAFSFMMSDYSERPVNLTYLYKRQDGQWRPGSPSDRETGILFQQQKAAWLELTQPAYGAVNRDWRRLADLGQLEAMASGRELSREQVWANIRKIEEMLAERVRAVPRSALADPSALTGQMRQSAWTRGMARLTQSMERVTRGGLHDTDERLHAWYAAQAYARIVMFAAEANIRTNKLYSEEVQDSLNAKKKLEQARVQQLELLSKPSLTAEEQVRLGALRGEISQLVRDIPRLEERARQYQTDNRNADKNLRGVADLANPFYNVNENVNMRDPRIAFGGGYAMGAALMVGYQTGQFVGERPQMWAGYHLLPGDRVMNLFARPNYYASMLFGMHTRTFFTKMTGYTTVYHQDPERGPMAANNHEPGVIEGVQSLFKPGLNFDWFTRFYANPVMRGFRARDYKDEFGWAIKEETNWGGIRYNLPWTFKYGKGVGGRGGGTDYTSEIDQRKYQAMGLDAGEEMRRRKIGLTFREEYLLWDRREQAENQMNMRQGIDAMRSRLNSITDPVERRMMQSQIREFGDVLNTTRTAWSLPGVRSFTRQNYYAVENRSGYDIAAIGESHRPWELYAWSHKNVGPVVPIPGMLYVDQEGSSRLFPRLARTISNPILTPTSNLYDRYANYKAGGESVQHKSPLSPFSMLQGMGDSMSMPGRERGTPGVEQDLFRDALRDVYRRETPALGKFFELDMQRQSWSFQNSEYTIPLAPLYLGLFHVFRHNSAWARQQTWNQHTPREKDLGEMTDEQRRAERAMHTARQAAIGLGDTSYRCPTHGLTIRGEQMCPLCRSAEAIRQEREQTGLDPWIRKKREQMKSWVTASFSFSEHIGQNYMHYQDQAHCSTHGIGYRRGTACPLCLEDAARRNGGEAAGRVEEFRRTVRDYEKRMREVETDRRVSEVERGKKLMALSEERETRLTQLNLQIERDTRMGYHQGLAYLQAEMERLRKMEAERNYKVEFI
ncbi:Uncharacterised protein [uncultured archaeon]|nr:Uncharacterised protein [uncultured archaeon]